MKRKLLLIIGLSLFQGCSASNSVEVDITFPDQAGKDATITLRIYSLIPGEGVSCNTLQDGTNSPDDGLSTIEDQQSVSNPFTDAISPLKVSKKNTATRLFFSQGENNVGMVIVRGCSEVKVGGEHKVPITLVACEPSCPSGKGNCDNDLKNGCESNLNTTVNCGGCGKICGSQNAISVACINGTCDMICVQGWANCDQIGSNGCETDMSKRDDCTVLEPVFDQPAGTYQNDLTVSISCGDPGATIYYTTDGVTTPTTASTEYTDTPILITGPDTTMTIEAIATNPGINQSPVASATYTVRYRYALTLTVNDATFGSIETSSPLVVEHGAATSIVATPSNTNYKLGNWTVTSGTGASFGDALNASTTVTLTEGNATIQANFILARNVYVAGYDGSNAKVWKDGTATSLNEGSGNAVAYSVFVSGGDVYVAGFEDDGTNAVAKVWKNGKIFQTLSDGTQWASAQSVFVSDNIVYVAGYENDGTKDVAKVWKVLEAGGVEATPLNNGSGDARAASVFVSGSDVYVAGYEYDGTTSKYVAKVWKDGALFQTLTDGSNDADANSVFVSGNDVYVAGYEYDVSMYHDVAKVWKDGALFKTLTDGSNNADANSVFVSGSDVYVAGYEKNGSYYVARVWKDGVLFQTLTDGTISVYAYSVFVAGSDVYVAAWEINALLSSASVWKNGTRLQTLASKMNNGARAYSVFVNVN